MLRPKTTETGHNFSGGGIRHYNLFPWCPGAVEVKNTIFHLRLFRQRIDLKK
jgi:hypothetical protein